MDNAQLARLFIQLSMFGLVLAIWLGGVTAWWVLRSQKRKTLERRLDFSQENVDDQRVIRLWHEGKAVDALVPDSLHMSFAERIDRLGRDAGWATPMPKIILILSGMMGALAALVWVITAQWLMVLAAVAMVFVCFRSYLLRCINNRTALFEKQLVEALDLGARSLRAGHPLSGAFKLIATEIGAPVSSVFAEIVEQEALGLSLQRALYGVSQKSRSPDMKIFATSVVIQLRSGGNLAEMIERVAWVVRERMRLNRRARVLTSEAQLSKWILLGLPLGLFLILDLINPEYMQPFFSTLIGNMMMVVAVCMLGMGAWLMNKMSVLKY